MSWHIAYILNTLKYPFDLKGLDDNFKNILLIYVLLWKKKLIHAVFLLCLFSEVSLRACELYYKRTLE